MKRYYIKYLIPIIILSLIGLFAINVSRNSVSNYSLFFRKQLLYLIIGVVLLILFSIVNFNYIKKYSLLVYIINIILLIYVLFFGNEINGSKSWINIFGISIQPSEFVKIWLLLCLDLYIKTKYGFIKGIIFLLIPSVLTFLQPDTGTVLFYIVIYFSIFISLGLKKKYYVYLFSLIIIVSLGFLYLYFFNSNLFISIFGTSFFYRIDRIINFVDNEGFQINNALISIGNGGLLGNGSKYIIYVPEIVTDFMYANVLTRFGFVGGIIVLLLFIYIDYLLIRDIKIVNKHKYFVVGLFGLILYQQVEHILMNIGLLPITGITLPFVSYGGSSLISYYILFGLLFNIKKYQVDT